MKYFFGVVCACMLIPNIVRANVLVNEIAWMGTSVSANDEWIELINDGGDAVDLSGWTLKAEDGEPSIPLSGTIEAGGFFLLERTDDTSVPGVPADQIYSGNMANTGETFVLRDTSGVAIDTVEGGSNWASVGGDNASKNTAQRQSDNTWITGVPTPRAENSTENIIPGGSSGGSPGGATKSNTPKVTGAYKQQVFAYAGEDTNTVVGANVSFQGFAVNEYNKDLSNPRFDWTFGDGEQRSGEKVTHVFREPGTYTVVLKVWHDNQRAEDTILVYAFPPEIRITDVVWGEDGFVEIQNGSLRDLDISGWKLRGRRFDNERRLKTFTFPDGTRIGPAMTVRFSEAIINLDVHLGDRVALLYPSEKVVAEYDPSLVGSVTVIDTIEPEEAKDILPPPVVITPPTEVATTSTTTIETLTATASAVSLGALPTGTSQNNRNTYFLLIGALGAVSLGFLLWNRVSRVREEEGILVDGERVVPSDFTISDTTPK